MINRRHGFTLIEIIIVISIMTIMLGVGMVSYNSFGSQKSLEQDAETMRDRINFTRERAVNRDIQANTACGTFDLYQLNFNVTSSPQSFSISLFCTSPTVQTVVETFNLGSSRIINPAANFAIQFFNPYGCINTGCNAASQTIIFENASGTQCINIIVNALGKTFIGQAYAC